MPSSSYEHISWMVARIRELQPETILDVGIGFGKWGFLCREYLDLWIDKRFKPPWKRRIDGIEVWEPYISMLHNYIYDSIVIGNALEIIKAPVDFGLLPTYSLIFAGDVLEHLEKPEGMGLLDNLLRMADVVIVCLPLGHFPQGAVFNNPYEVHQSTWEVKDFDEYNLIASKEWEILSKAGRRYWSGIFNGRGAK